MEVLTAVLPTGANAMTPDSLLPGIPLLFMLGDQYNVRSTPALYRLSVLVIYGVSVLEAYCEGWISRQL